MNGPGEKVEVGEHLRISQWNAFVPPERSERVPSDGATPEVLRLWQIGPDTVAAPSLDAAAKFLCSWCGYDPSEIEDDLERAPELDPDDDLEIGFDEVDDADLPKTYHAKRRVRREGGEWVSYGPVLVRAKVRDWLATCKGPTLLCSEEW